MLHVTNRTETVAEPRIVLSSDDADRLMNLASAASGTLSAVADALMHEAGRAEVVAPHRLPSDTVAMDATVAFRDQGTGRVREVQLVYPHEADIARGKISVLTPIGVALIGLSTGQSMAWQGPDGVSHRLTVVRVHQHHEEARAR
jgi:regulator of nucleoside diphosphate kinase